MELQQKVNNFIEPMLEDVSHVVVGVSGGADSVCLLHLLSKLLPAKGIGLSAVHVNHGIRTEAMDDQKYVEEICEKWSIPLHCFKKDVPAISKENGMSEEEAGRYVRYQCYAKVVENEIENEMEKQTANQTSESPKDFAEKQDTKILKHSSKKIVVALAHHMQDQAETVLFRMCRGTGVDGLSGIRPKMIREDGLCVIRPLLCATRQEIEEYLRVNGIAYMEDSTNKDTNYTRNQIRHNVIPELEQVNEKAVEHICKLADLANQQSRFIRKIIDDIYDEYVFAETILGQNTGYLMVNASWLASQDDVVIEGILRRMIFEKAAGLKDISGKHILLLKDLLLKKHQECVQLPFELEGFICYENLLIGKTNTEQGNCENLVKFHTENVPKSFENGLSSKKNYTQFVDYAKINDKLSLRWAKSGDMIEIDLDGHQKNLNRLFIDEKVPKHMRHQIPVVCDGDRVVWVVGYRLNPAYYVDSSTTKVVRMELVKADDELDAYTESI